MQPIYFSYHFFLHYGWFFQNHGKEAVRTFMHTNVAAVIQLYLVTKKKETSLIERMMIFLFLKPQNIKVSIQIGPSSLSSNSIPTCCVRYVQCAYFLRGLFKYSKACSWKLKLVPSIFA